MMTAAATPAVQKHFMILFDTATSPDREFLIACSTYGDLFVWNMSSILGRRGTKQYDEDNEDDDIDHVPCFVFRPFPKQTLGAVYRLETIQNLLLVATFEALYIYRWNDITDGIARNQNPSPIHKYIAPQIEYEHGAKSRYVEINALAYNDRRDSVFLGTGHCSIFELNVNKLKLMNRLNGHKDYVLDLSINNSHNVLTSSSNDGTVKVWDVNANPSPLVASFNGNTNDNTNGYYANCCELHENGRYIVSGLSGTKKNKICLFELNMKSLITELVVDPSHNYIPQVVKFSNVWRHSNQSNLSICAGFNHSSLYLLDRRYNANSNKLTHSRCTIQTSSKSIWSIRTWQNIAFVCGTSNRVDLIANTANAITSLSAVSPSNSSKS